MSSKGGRKKQKIKRETKEVGMDIHPRKGVLKKERTFQTPGNTVTGKSVVRLGTSEGNITGRKNK